MAGESAASRDRDAHGCTLMLGCSWLGLQSIIVGTIWREPVPLDDIDEVPI
jgi:hypothetical protein